jgi:phosphoenolpyruvate carboxylase
LESWLVPPASPPAEWRDVMERLATDARRVYRAYTQGDAQFPAYFSASTPQDELAELNIGSRPSRRASDGGLAALRAIPWQFAWTQTRLLLGSWLGVEEALERAAARGEREALTHMYRTWPYFRSALDLIEMVLAKADGRIAAEYDRQLVPEPLRPLGEALRLRLNRAIEALLDVTGHPTLLFENPVLRRSIDVRNPYVDPINLVQVELLRRVRSGDADARLRHALMVTINGVAAGMRNTG